MNKKALSIFFFTISIYCLSAQTSSLLRGVVRDTSGSLLPYVSVTTQLKDSSVILTFGTTNTEGVFSVNKPNVKRFLLKANTLGYEAKSIWVESDSLNFDFVLVPKSFMLKEAVVTSNSRIVERNDTITYKADAFRDSTERNLEELLAKLPGVEVNKNTGVITVQGKAIKKILIEGDDLTGHNYQLLSQNMSAGVVDKIQIIDRFTENKLLKGIKKTDDKVINITIKDNRKGLLFGSASVGLGTDCRTENGSNFMTINKYVKAINFLNFNNTGLKSRAYQLLNTELSDDEDLQQNPLIDAQIDRLIEISSLPSTQLSSQNIQFNKAGMGSSHFIIRPNNKFSIKGQLTYSRDNIKVFTENQSRYLLKDSIFNIEERDTFNTMPIVFEAKIGTQLDISANSILKITSQFQKTNLNTTLKTVINDKYISNFLTDKNINTHNALDYTYKISDNKALTINSLWVKTNNKQVLNTNQLQNRTLPLGVSEFGNGNFHQTNQNIEKPLNYISSTVQYLYSNTKTDFNLSCGYISRLDNLKSQLLIDSTKLDNNFLNDLIFEQKNAFISINLNYKLKFSQLFFNTSSGFYQQQLLGIDKKETLEGKKIYTLPTFGYSWTKGKKSIFMTYGYNISLPKINDVTQGYIITGYRNIIQGATTLNNMEGHTLITNTRLGKIEDKFMGNVNIIASIQNRGYRPDLVISPDYQLASKIENLLSSKTLRLSSTFEYYAASLYMRFKLRPTLGIFSYQNVLNGSDIRQLNMTNKNLDISVRSAFLKWFNFHVGGNMSVSNVSLLGKNSINFNKNQHIGAFFDSFMRFNKKLSIKLDNEFFAFYQAKSTSKSYFFSNLSFNYALNKPNIRLSLTVKNMLNSPAFVSNSVSDYLINTNKVNLIPRYLLFEIDFSF